VTRVTRRTAVPLLVSLVAPGAACSGDRPAGPLPPAQCGARATQGAGAPGFALLFGASRGAPLPLAIEPRLTIIRIR